jgi:arginase
MSFPALELIAWPYHAGLRDVSMGLGANALAADHELRAGLAAADLSVTVETIPPVDESLPEVARIFELDRRLARRVATACARGAFPLVLGGNCISCLGTVAGAGADGVVWFDAHADFDTTDDNLSGFTDVFGLAILTGTGWRALRETIRGFAPVPEERVVLAAVRDLEPYQRERLDASAVLTVPGAFEPGALAAALDELAGAVRDSAGAARDDLARVVGDTPASALDGPAGAAARVYIHVDLDALDAGVGRANPYAAQGGPSLGALLDGIGAVFDRFTVTSAALTAYDPRVDDDGAIAAAARRIAALIARRAAHQRLTREPR